jgi:exopolysaccharide biosynthesis polyprenyl glycosylphosphotransferase
MKRSELLLSSILVPLDFAAIILAGLSAYYLRFAPAISSSMPVTFHLPVWPYFRILLLIATAWLVVFVFSGLYAIRQQRKLRNEFKKVLMAASLGLVVLVVYMFFVRDLFSSRFIVLIGWLMLIIYMSLSRIILLAIKRSLFQHGWGLRYVVIIGSSKSSDILVQEFSSKPSLGCEVVKRFDNFGIEEANELAKILTFKEVDEVIQSDPNLSKAEVLRLYDFADEHHLTFKYAADLLGTKVLRVEVTELAGIPIAEVKKTPLDGWGRILKRLFDIVVSFFLIVLFSPIMIITAILIKLDSRGPIFFSRLDDNSPLQRVGQNGQTFRYLKFRSMLPGTNDMRYQELADHNIRTEGPMVKIKDDPRVTKIGKFIRRFSIDELPELFLVFIGSMSLVGPRPHLPEEVAKYQSHHKKVLTIKPGVTGMAQVSGRSDLSFEDEVKLDSYYIENWSLWLDLVILIKTPLAVFKHRQAE